MAEALSGQKPVPCTGLVCHIGAITGRGCDGNETCPLVTLAERGVIGFKVVLPDHKEANKNADLEGTTAHPDFEHWTCGTDHNRAERVLRIIERGLDVWSERAIEAIINLVYEAGPANCRASLEYSRHERAPF
tara:strand:+ start:2477 stop:2875 length:399 start_codon:yes stop_codon:yes gene_type:complete